MTRIGRVRFARRPHALGDGKQYPDGSVEITQSTTPVSEILTLVTRDRVDCERPVRRWTADCLTQKSLQPGGDAIYPQLEDVASWSRSRASQLGNH